MGGNPFIPPRRPDSANIGIGRHHRMGIFVNSGIGHTLPLPHFRWIPLLWGSKWRIHGDGGDTPYPIDHIPYPIGVKCTDGGVALLR